MYLKADDSVVGDGHRYLNDDSMSVYLMADDSVVDGHSLCTLWLTIRLFRCRPMLQVVVKASHLTSLTVVLSI